MRDLCNISVVIRDKNNIYFNAKVNSSLQRLINICI